MDRSSVYLICNKLMSLWPMRSLFKVTFSFFLQNSELGSFQCVRWKGSAVGNISHRTCLFFDLLKHGLEIVNHCSSFCLPLLLLPWEQHPHKPVIQPAGLLKD